MNKKTILVIDDDEEVLSLFETFLSNIGYNSVTKASGESAKKWLKSNKPDLVLLDMMLPDIMGIDFAKWISSNKKLKGTPVIHMTAFLSDDIAREDSMLSGAKDFITKPPDFEAVEKKIKSILEG